MLDLDDPEVVSRLVADLPTPRRAHSPDDELDSMDREIRKLSRFQLLLSKSEEPRVSGGCRLGPGSCLSPPPTNGSKTSVACP